MNLQHLGTDYGGWTVDLDSIPDGSIVIDAGVRYDSSFMRALLELKQVTVIAIDPSAETIDHFAELGLPSRTVFLPVALTPNGAPVVMWKGDDRSDSGCSDMPGLTNRSYPASGIALAELVQNNPVSLVKLDIEGMEFEIVKQSIGVPQVSVEFHVDHMPDRREDMDRIIASFASAGYAVVHRTEKNEITFLRT